MLGAVVWWLVMCFVALVCGVVLSSICRQAAIEETGIQLTSIFGERVSVEKARVLSIRRYRAGFDHLQIRVKPKSLFAFRLGYFVLLPKEYWVRDEFLKALEKEFDLSKSLVLGDV